MKDKVVNKTQKTNRQQFPTACPGKTGISTGAEDKFSNHNLENLRVSTRSRQESMKKCENDFGQKKKFHSLYFYPKGK